MAILLLGNFSGLTTAPDGAALDDAPLPTCTRVGGSFSFTAAEPSPPPALHGAVRAGAGTRVAAGAPVALRAVCWRPCAAAGAPPNGWLLPPRADDAGEREFERSPRAEAERAFAPAPTLPPTCAWPAAAPAVPAAPPLPFALRKVGLVAPSDAGRAPTVGRVAAPPFARPPPVGGGRGRAGGAVPEALFGCGPRALSDRPAPRPDGPFTPPPRPVPREPPCEAAAEPSMAAARPTLGDARDRAQTRSPTSRPTFRVGVQKLGVELVQSSAVGKFLALHCNTCRHMLLDRGQLHAGGLWRGPD